MKCPKCQGNTDCLDSRDRKDYRHRRRKCQECAHRFTTMEMLHVSLRAQIVKELKIMMSPKVMPALLEGLMGGLEQLVTKIENDNKKEKA